MIVFEKCILLIISIAFRSIQGNICVSTCQEQGYTVDVFMKDFFYIFYKIDDFFMFLNGDFVLQNHQVPTDQAPIK